MIQTTPTTHAGRLFRTRREQGLCATCGTPVALNAKGRRPYECTSCRKKHAEAHRMAAVTWRGRRRANGECVQCGKPVTTTNKRTGLTTARCTSCARLQSGVQQRWREARSLASLGIAS